MRILLSPYQATWPLLFEEEAERLSDIVPRSEALAVHVGSTAVAGMLAKPIVDILYGVCDAAALDRVRDSINDSAGYIYVRAYEAFHPQRRFFIRPKPHASSRWPRILDEIDWAHEIDMADRASHIHVVPVGSVTWTRMIAFRDHLRSCGEARRRYRRHKIALARRTWVSSKEYALAKDELIGAILDQAQI